LVTCPKCGKVKIAEEFENHYCVPPITGLKEILIDQDGWYEAKDSRGRQALHARGTDGTLYTLVKTEPPDESKQEDYAEWLDRHPSWDGSTRHPRHGTEPTSGGAMFLSLFHSTSFVKWGNQKSPLLKRRDHP
jgi:hypothetical protein